MSLTTEIECCLCRLSHGLLSSECIAEESLHCRAPGDGCSVVGVAVTVKLYSASCGMPVRANPNRSGWRAIARRDALRVSVSHGWALDGRLALHG